MNLIHWIVSFSTVGLDVHLGFRQKGLGEAKRLHFSFSGIGRRAEREGGRARALAHFPRKIFAQKSRSTGALNAGTEIEVFLCTGIEEKYGLYLIL